MQSKAKTIPEYIAGLPEEQQEVIARLDRLVREHAPGALGSMKYGMPTYEVGTRMLAINAQKNYYSFYADPEVVKRFRSQLKGLSVGKSCIRFKRMADAPLEVLGGIVDAYAG